MSEQVNVFEYSKTHPLYISHPKGGRRVIAELFKSMEGLIFFDVYWCISDGHPIHAVGAKKMVHMHQEDGSNMWLITLPESEAAVIGGVYIGTASIHELKEGDELWNEYLDWEEFKKTIDEGKNATTKRAYSSISGK